MHTPALIGKHNAIVTTNAMYAKNIYKRLELEYHTALKEILRSIQHQEWKGAINKLPFAIETATQHRLHKTRHYIVSGISGSGKTSIAKILEESGFTKIPNVTTRLPRHDETSKDYIFVSKATFEQWRKRKALFDPHKTNKSWHAIRKSDLRKFEGSKKPYYADKSVSSLLRLVKMLQGHNYTLVYVLVPSFRVLYERTRQREKNGKRKGGRFLNEKEIFERFEEEITELKRSKNLQYVYVVNDSLKRVKKILSLGKTFLHKYGSSSFA